jgi:hypothetical protein
VDNVPIVGGGAGATERLGGLSRRRRWTRLKHNRCRNTTCHHGPGVSGSDTFAD